MMAATAAGLLAIDDPSAQIGLLSSLILAHTIFNALQNVAVDVYRLTLSVRIDDRTQQGREVYRATAVASSRQDQLSAAMPYLARALFDRFPGRNGQVVEVRYPVE